MGHSDACRTDAQLLHTLRVPQGGYLVAITVSIASIHTEGIPRVKLVGNRSTPQIEGDRLFEHSLSFYLNLLEVTCFLTDDIAEALSAYLDLLVVFLSVDVSGCQLWSRSWEIP